MTTFSRWLPAITRNPIIRKAALTAAGLAFTGGALTAPATTAHAAPSTTKPAAATHQNNDKAAAGKELTIRYEPQPNFYYCGPAATRNALTAQGKTISQDEIANQLGTTEDGTNSAEDTTRVLNKLTDGRTYKTTAIPGKSASKDDTHRLADNIIHAIDTDKAVVANIAGTATDTDGETHSYEGGHYLAIVGYRDHGNQVKIADSANPNVASYWMTTDHMADWIATRGYSA